MCIKYFVSSVFEPMSRSECFHFFDSKGLDEEFSWLWKASVFLKNRFCTFHFFVQMKYFCIHQTDKRYGNNFLLEQAKLTNQIWMTGDWTEGFNVVFICAPTSQQNVTEGQCLMRDLRKAVQKLLMLPWHFSVWGLLRHRVMIPDPFQIELILFSTYPE